MWKMETSDIDAGRRYRILDDGSCLSFRQFFDLLDSSEDFADWYSDTIAAFETAAFYWELPPLSSSTFDDDAEFVLIDAPSLARLPPEPTPFASQFESCPGQDVVVFPNLGGDAILVVPCPLGPAATYPHLAAFLRLAAKAQIRALWRVTAETLLHRIGEAPIWLSTAGIGVAWLHLRLDSRPKYYRHRPYRDAS
jgi:hypothetical protein